MVRQIFKTWSLLATSLILSSCASVVAPPLYDLTDRFQPAPPAKSSTGLRLDIGKCVNLSNMLDAPREGDWGRRFEDADVDRIADMGFKAVRLPAKFSAYALDSPPYTIDSAFMDRVAHIVDLATARGLNVLIDLHHYDEIMEDPATHTDRLAGMWRQIGERFAGAPSSVSFELLNEPHGNLDASNLLSTISPALAEIRRTNPTRIVVIDGPSWAGLPEMLDAPFPDDRYAVPTFHYYSPVNFGFPDADWLEPRSRDWFGSAEDLALIEADLAKVRAYMERTGRVPFVGEYGAWATRPLAMREAYYETVSEAFASIGVDSCAWGYANTFDLWNIRKGDWQGDIAQRIAAPVRD